MPSATGTSSGPRLKLVIRRLPPGLTEDEFQTALGTEWKVGNGKVDWAIFKAGKVSKDSAAKPSKPSRAYLNLTKQEYVGALSESVRNTTFNDSKNTSKDSALRGPPSVEFAPYRKTPRTKTRKDARQGTIDQDSEFIEFLESLTNPVSKAASVDQSSKSKEKVTTTPLIQFLKEKKANKGKESAVATVKGAKHARQGSKDSPSNPTSSSDKSSPAKAVPLAASVPDKRSAQAIMVEKAARDAARIVNKQAPIASKPQPPSPASTSSATPVVTAATSPLAEKKRERGSASAAASILRRDLGIATSPGGRGGRRGGPLGQNRPSSTTSGQVTSAVTSQKDATKAADSLASPAPPPANGSLATTPGAISKPAQSPQTSQPPTGPAASRIPKGQATPPAASAANTAPKPVPVPSTATQAFLKHANPSQGITEPLLEEAFAAYGAVKSVEIDRKKGSAYVDFEEPEGLQKAIKASPVKVAQGQVIVLERRMGPNPPTRNTRGGPIMNNTGPMNARGGMLNQRGGIGNRGGGVPMGPMGARGGGARGRGGFARGRANVPNAASARPAAATTPQPGQESKDAASAVTASNDSIPAPSEPSNEATKPGPVAPSEGVGNNT
ncbi:MAG: hypothetical protein LQ346_008766 [Caloplaca aetnensis]|nr:MAG: hypothetical protein LQ346_008766 [Caloplaca aetnensis]